MDNMVTTQPTLDRVAGRIKLPVPTNITLHFATFNLLKHSFVRHYGKGVDVAINQIHKRNKSESTPFSFATIQAC